MAESDLDYALVTGRFALAVADSDDPGDNPDVIYCNQGTVEFTPLITFEKVAEGTPWPFEAGHSVFVAEISDDDYVDPTVVGVDRTGARDGAGHLTWRGKPFIKLIDLTSSKINPNISDPAKATHSVAFKNVKAVIDGTPVNVNFPARPGRFTKDGPDGDGKNDLIRVLPVVTGSSTPITVGPRGISIVSAAVSPEGELLFTFSDDTEQSAGELPGTADAIEAATTATAAADTATTKAGEASTAATDATTAKDDAEVAKADAETAKVDAQTAKSDAEAARADLLGQKAQPSGIAPLDGSSKVPTTHLPTATATGVGAVELATNTEATTGTDTQRAVTPAGVKAVVDTIRDLSDATFANNLSASIDGRVADLVAGDEGTLFDFGVNALNDALAAGAGTDPTLTVRTNLALNPNGTNAGGWSTDTTRYGTKTADATKPGANGKAAWKLTRTASGASATIGQISYLGQTTASIAAGLAVTAGKTYTWSDSVESPVAARGRLTVVFYDAANVAVGSAVNSADVPMTVNTKTLVAVTITVPAGAVKATCQGAVITPTGGGNAVTGTASWFYPEFLLEEAASAGAFFDGSTPDVTNVDYAWTGTANASTSTETTTVPGVVGLEVEPPQFGADIKDRVLCEWTAGRSWRGATSIVHDASGILVSMNVIWPDLSAGVLTVTSANGRFNGVDGFTVTHVDSGRKVTQSPVTRDASGVVTDIPSLTVGAI